MDIDLWYEFYKPEFAALRTMADVAVGTLCWKCLDWEPLPWAESLLIDGLWHVPGDPWGTPKACDLWVDFRQFQGA